MVTDPISDYLTRIRNASMARHLKVDIPYSKMKESMTKVLLEEGYIRAYRLLEDDRNIRIALKYTREKREPVIAKIFRISKCGLRKYAKNKRLPRVLNGLGIAIISTSKGIMTNKKAIRENLGGEIICYVY